MQVAYAIGVVKPVSVMVDTFGTATVDEGKIIKAVEQVFDLTPKGIIDKLNHEINAGLADPKIIARLADLGGDGLEINATLGQLLDNLGALGGVGPAGAEVFEAGAEGADLFGRVVSEFDDAELFAVGVEFVDQFGGDFDLAAVEIKLSTPHPSPLPGRGGEGGVSKAAGGILD